MSDYYKKRPERQYTITDARTDIEYLNTCYSRLESTLKSLRDEVDSLRRDEWRALDLCAMMKRRLDVMDTLMLIAFSAEGQRYLTHHAITELRRTEVSI